MSSTRTVPADIRTNTSGYQDKKKRSKHKYLQPHFSTTTKYVAISSSTSTAMEAAAKFPKTSMTVESKAKTFSLTKSASCRSI